MRGEADRRVVQVKIVAYRAHDHLAGVQTHPDLDLAAVRPPHLRHVLGNPRLHVQGRIAATDGVILVSERRAEEGHDPVAHDLVHDTLVLVDSPDHALEHRIDELARLLGVAFREHLGRALEVRKQHSDLLALTFERALRAQDAIGQVARGIARRGAKATGRPGWTIDRVAAFRAETRRRGKGGSTAIARHGVPPWLRLGRLAEPRKRIALRRRGQRRRKGRAPLRRLRQPLRRGPPFPLIRH